MSLLFFMVKLKLCKLFVFLLWKDLSMHCYRIVFTMSFVLCIILISQYYIENPIIQTFIISKMKLPVLHFPFAVILEMLSVSRSAFVAQRAVLTARCFSAAAADKYLFGIE